MTKVPSTVPSNPLAFIASSLQIIRKDAAMNRPRKHHGAHAPVLSIQVMNAFKKAKSVAGPARLPLRQAGSGSRGLHESGNHLISGEAIELDRLVPRGVPPHDVHPVARAVQLLRQEP